MRVVAGRSRSPRPRVSPCSLTAQSASRRRHGAGVRQLRCMPGAAVSPHGDCRRAVPHGPRAENYISQSAPRRAGPARPAGGKGGIHARTRAVVGWGGRGLTGAGRAAEAAEAAAAAGWVGMEPGEGPGALDLHGDEEIIEVVELGPPGPGETGHPAPRTGRGLRGLWPPAGAPGALRPHPSARPGRCIPPARGLSPRRASFPCGFPALGFVAAAASRIPRCPVPPSPQPPREGRAGQAASRALTFALCR